MKPSDFTAFYQKNVQRVFRYVLFRVSCNQEVAEDLTQDIFLKAYKAFGSYDAARSGSSWIYTIAKNTLIDWYKKQHPTEDIANYEDALSFSVNAWELHSANEDSKALLGLIASLPDDDAALVRMRYLEGWDYAGLAPVLQKTENALRAQASRALKRLRRQIRL
ncbi:MAG: RNA polymerase sigma factor [Patescibacteria group bacterium]